MEFPRPSSESQPRPTKAVDVLQAVEDEAESGLMFDPKVDISKSSVEAIFERMEDLRSNNRLDIFFHMLAGVSDLFPNIKAVDQIKSEDFDFFRREMDKEKYTFDNIELVKDIVVLCSDQHLLSKRDKTMFDNMKKCLDENRDCHWWNFGQIALNIMRIFPNLRGDLVLGESEYNAMKAELDHHRKIKNWWGFVNLAMVLSIIYPEHKSDIKLNDETINNTKKELASLERDHCWFHFVDFALCLAVLAAEKVVIDSNGKCKFFYKPKTLGKVRTSLPIVSRVQRSSE